MMGYYWVSLRVTTTKSRVNTVVTHTCKYQAHPKQSKVSPIGKISPQMFSTRSMSIQQPGLKGPSISCMYRTFPCPM